MTLIARERIELDPLAFSTANTRRTPGTHLTDVVRDMLGKLGINKARGNTFTGAQLNAYALQGFLWEDAMSETLVNRVRSSNGAAIGLANHYVRLPEIATDGREAFCVEYSTATPATPSVLLTPIPPTFIVMTPDGGVLNQGVHLLECKWTTKGVPKWDDDAQVRSDILSKWLGANRPDWLWQVPCYLRGLSLALGYEVNTAQWHLQFACGDWCVKLVSDDEGRMIPLSPVPAYERWTREYSAQEVTDKWDAVYGHARDGGMLNGTAAR